MSRGLLLVAYVAQAWAADNGMAITPPMGWRSWNFYGRNVDQDLMETIMRGMVSRARDVDGTPTSLCDLGYCDVGLDDNWQNCDGGVHSNFHDQHGFPVVNTVAFPSMGNMTALAHSLKLTAGWYGNNCICAETTTTAKKYYDGDVKSLVGYGYDGVKLDGCGVQTDLQQYYDLINATGKAITIENCHWGRKVPFEPTLDWCPWNFYRTSEDIRASYASIVANLQTTIKYSTTGLSRPGCWAYPDMLEVGSSHGPGGNADPGLNPAETRSHFAAWCIVSSPLTLSHDVNNNTIMDAIWPVIANIESIEVNQAWQGHSGSPFQGSDRNVTLHSPANFAQLEKGTGKEEEEEEQGVGPVNVPSFQYFYKPVSPTRTAVLLMNHDSTPQDLTFSFANVPDLPCKTHCTVRDIFKRKDIGAFSDSYTATQVQPHDAAFLMLETP